MSYRHLFVMAVCLPAVALAADLDADGVDDADDNCLGVANPGQEDDDSDGHGNACVAASATFSSSATLGYGAQVRGYSSVGEHTVLGTNVTVAERVTIADAPDSANATVLGDESVLGRRAQLGIHVTLGADNVLGRAVSVDDDVTTDDNVTIGYGSHIRAGATIGTRVAIGSLVDIGADAVVGDDVVVARSGVIGASTTVADGAILGPEVDVAEGVTIGSNARLRRGVEVGSGATVHPSARIGRDVIIGSNAEIGPNAVLGAQSEVRPNAVVDSDARIARSTIVEASAAGIILQGGSRRFADGTVADRCETYRRPGVGYTFTGTEAVSGLYTIDAGGVERVAYCDMTTLGGGWTQITYMDRSDNISGNAQWSAIFSSLSGGDVTTGSHKLDATGLVETATHLRYSEPAGSNSIPTTDSWPLDFECDVDDAVRSKWLNPGYRNQVPAPIVCRDVATGSVSTNAILTNYQSWHNGWTYDRLWIGSAAASPEYHGDYCADCIVTWKQVGTNHTGVYSGISATHGAGSYTRDAAFWVR